jgi:hypothetical protein
MMVAVGRWSIWYGGGRQLRFDCIQGLIFSQARNELGVSLFLPGNEFLNYFPVHLVPSWERAKNTATV